MATNSLMLSIPNPCSENWNNMTPQEKGRFCDTCQKCVVDFTAMTDAAVLDYFNKNNGKICGRFDKRQLDRVLIINDKRFQKRFNIAASLLLLSSLGFGNTVKNDAVIPFKVSSFYVQKSIVKKNTSSLNEPLSDEMITVKGHVFDIKKEPIIGAAIVMKGSTIGTTTDTNGAFSITLKREYFEKGFLYISCAGYGTQEYELSKFKVGEFLVFEIIETVLAGDIVIRRPNLWKRFTNLFRRKGHKKW
jgi:CarboxypepD_reg-like domain